MIGATSERTISPEEFQRGLRQQLFPSTPGVKLYAVLDGASIPNLLSRLYSKPSPEFVSLYRGELEREIAEVSPYLVSLEPRSPFTDWILAEGWGSHWGIFAASRASFKDMRKHFRTFLRVQLPAGKPVYFRYYDPRAWRAFLPTADSGQLRRLFGPIQSFTCEGAELDQLLHYELERGKLSAQALRPGRDEKPRPVELAPPAAAQSSLLLPHNGDEGILLRIRQEQLDAFSGPRREQLPRKVAKYLRDECPKETATMSDAELDAFIREGFKRAAGYGMSVEWDLCRFCWLAALYGTEFDVERDWARNVLALAEDSPTERMDQLETYQRNYLAQLFSTA